MCDIQFFSFNKNIPYIIMLNMSKYIFNISVMLLSLSVVLSTSCGKGGDSNQGDNNIVVASNVSSLSWTPPQSYEDKSALPVSKIGGYKIYIGTSKENMQLNTDINDPAITEFGLGGLDKGVYYIAVSCYDAELSESRLSPVIIIELR